MIYGNVMKYKYEDARLDESGNFLLDEQEIPLTEAKEIVLVFNAITLIKYKNYTGRDFLSDFISMGEKAVKSAQKVNLGKELTQKLERGEDPTLEDLKEIDSESIDADMLDTEFFVNIIGAMIAASNPHATKDFFDIIDEVPIMLLYDPDFMRELMQFITFGLKKNKMTFSKILRPKL